MMPMPRALALAVALTGLPACSGGGGNGGESSGGGGTAQQSTPAKPAYDLSGDKAAAEKSWLLALAVDAAPLTGLAESSEGWRHLFTADPGAALEAFEADLKSAPPENAAVLRIGAARAALELAQAHQNLALMIRESTSGLLKAQVGLPGGEKAKSWAGWIHARLPADLVKEGAPKLGTLAEGDPVAPWAAAIAKEASGPLADLLAGRAAGVEATVPEGSSAAHKTRLMALSLVEAGRLREARKRLERLDPRRPDIEISLGDQSVTFRDPVAAGARARAFAAVVVELLKEEQGWPVLLRAEAELILGRTEAAIASVDAALASKTEPVLSQLILSGHFDAADLKAWGQCIKALALAESGKAEEGKAVIATIDRGTVSRKVSHALATSAMGDKVPEDAFPEDRDVITGLLGDLLTNLKEAKGRDDVVALLLVDRHVDALQRRIADALTHAGQRAIAVRVRTAAEDKAEAFAPSPRNSLSALTSGALGYVRIGQPRVALKYLSRMTERLKGAYAPMEMLRDRLTIRAMDRAGGVSNGN